MPPEAGTVQRSPAWEKTIVSPWMSGKRRSRASAGGFRGSGGGGKGEKKGQEGQKSSVRSLHGTREYVFAGRMF